MATRRFRAGTTYVNSKAVERVEHHGDGQVTLHMKGGSKITGVLKKAPRPSPASQDDERVVA